MAYNSRTCSHYGLMPLHFKAARAAKMKSLPLKQSKIDHFSLYF